MSLRLAPLHDDAGRRSILLVESFSAATAGEEMEKMKTTQADITAITSREINFDSGRNRESGRILAIVDKASLTPDGLDRGGNGDSVSLDIVLSRQHDSSTQVSRSCSDEEGSPHTLPSPRSKSLASRSSWPAEAERKRTTLVRELRRNALVPDLLEPRSRILGKGKKKKERSERKEQRSR